MTVIERIQAYRDNPGVNQSKIKRIISVDDPEEEKLPGRKQYMETGDIVDSIITIPQDYWENKFLIVEAENRPGGAMDKIVNYVWNNRGEQEMLLALPDKIEEAVLIEEYVGNKHWGISQRINKVVEECSSYWDFLLEAQGRTIVLKKDWAICNMVAQNLKSSPNTTKYFAENGLTLTSEYQLDVYGTLNEVSCKGLLDKCLFNEQDRTIQPLDFKVTGTNVREWKYQARKSRADIQASFYTALLKQKFVDWRVLPFAFLVASSNPNVMPYVYHCTEKDLHIGEYGATRVKSYLLNEDMVVITQEEDIIYGWRDALEIYKDAVRLGIDDFDLDSFYSGRVKPLDVWS